MNIPAFLVLIAALLILSACASTSTPPTETTSVATISNAPAAAGTPMTTMSSGAMPSADAATGAIMAPQDYRIGPQDLLKVEVFGVEAMNRSVRVNASGQIALPLVGLIQAGGLTGEQLAAAIAARLAKDYLQNPQVSIFIEEFSSQRVIVVGAVKGQTVFPLKGRTTLLQVVTSAGGPSSVATSTVLVLRSEPDGTRKILQYDIGDIRDGKIPDPEVYGGDVIQVEASAIKSATKEISEFVFPFMFLTP